MRRQQIKGLSVYLGNNYMNQDGRRSERYRKERDRERGWEGGRESVCAREKRPYSAEIRWYSPFVQNEFIRGVRDSHCGGIKVSV